MSWNISPSVKAKFDAVSELRSKQRCTISEACAKVGMPRGTYTHAYWKLYGAGSAKNGTPIVRKRAQSSPTSLPPTFDAEKVVPALVEEVRKLIRKIDAELEAHDRLIAARARLMAMANAGALEERMSDVEQTRVAALLGE